MYYACRSDSRSGIYRMSKTLKGFGKFYSDDTELIIYTKRPHVAEYGVFYTVKDGKVKRKVPSTIHDIGFGRMLEL